MNEGYLFAIAEARRNRSGSVYELRMSVEPEVTMTPDVPKTQVRGKQK